MILALKLQAAEGLLVAGGATLTVPDSPLLSSLFSAICVYFVLVNCSSSCRSQWDQSSE